MQNLPELKMGELKATLPIIQGGMGVAISLSNLAAAVANEGGIGVISGTGLFLLEKNYKKNVLAAYKKNLKEQIQKAREKTTGIIGINLLVALTDYEELLLSAYEAGADLFFLGAGLPLKFPNIPEDKIKKIIRKIVPIISSHRSANLICKIWSKKYNFIPDAFVLEGPLAGGHLGFKKDQVDKPEYQLEYLLPETLKILKPYETKFNKKIPVIVAGGIYTGADIYKFIKMGASGVQLGTRFVCTEECDASNEFKQKYIDCKKEDIHLIDSPVGLPGRAIKNEFLKKVERGELTPFKCPWKCLRTCDYKTAPYCIGLALNNAQSGHLENGFAFAGANAYRVDKITTVKNLIQELVSEYKKAADN